MITPASARKNASLSKSGCGYAVPRCQPFAGALRNADHAAYLASLSGMYGALVIPVKSGSSRKLTQTSLPPNPATPGSSPFLPMSNVQ